MNSPFPEEKLTAYALGELSPEERKRVEAELAAHPELKAELEAIQSLASQLRNELAEEVSDLKTEQPVSVVRPAPAKVAPDDDKIISFRRNPWLFGAGLLAAAACAALMFLPTASLDPSNAKREAATMKVQSTLLNEEVTVGLPEAAAEMVVEEIPASPLPMEALPVNAPPPPSSVMDQSRAYADAPSASVLTMPSLPAPVAGTASSGGASSSKQLADATRKPATSQNQFSKNQFGYVVSGNLTSSPGVSDGISTPIESNASVGGAVSSSSFGAPKRRVDLAENKPADKENASLDDLKSDYAARKERFEKIEAMSQEDLDKALPVLGTDNQITNTKMALEEEKAKLEVLTKEKGASSHAAVAVSQARVQSLQQNLDEKVAGIKKGFAVDLAISKARLEEEERAVAWRQSYLRRLKTAPAAGESYTPITDNAFLRVSDQALSTFSIDVDTGSYTNLRRFLDQNQLPPPDAVRIEELVNYFSYKYPQPKNEDPFSVTTEVAKAPWKDDHLLVRIGLQGKTVSEKDRPPANLVFLIDVSGSMDSANKLPLVINSMKMLVQKLKPEDRVGIAVYAGSSGMVLPSTPASHKGEILNALGNLQAGGSTNGAMGIQLAYDMAKAHFIEGGINRVILCTDGDFNVGVTSHKDLISLIEEKAKSKVFLSVFGFGMGNLKDSTLEQLANKGNGNYGYIDNPKEAKRVFVDQVGGTLQTIAKDVKIQVEFNPAVVSSYRLIGYENRMLAAEDFNNDKKDAGEIGAGLRVTALYEIVPVGVQDEKPSIDPLKYQKPAPVEYAGDKSEIMNVKLRYKQPEGDTSKLIEQPVKNENIRSFAPEKGGWFRSAPEQVSNDFQFAAGVAAFGMILRDSPYKGEANFDLVLRLSGKGADDREEDRMEFINLVKKARGFLKED